MRIVITIVCLTLLSLSCNNKTASTGKANASLAQLFENYYNERMALIPLEATQNGESEHNDKLYADFTDSYRNKLKAFFINYRSQIARVDRQSLSTEDRISYDIFKREMFVSIEGLNAQYFSNYVLYPEHQLMPFNQFNGVPLWLGQLGSGTGSQPFKTVEDYDRWIRRASSFTAWADSAVLYFSEGIKRGIVLPAALVKKMIPQMEAFVVSDPKTSLFYGPVNLMPATFSNEDKNRITADMASLINKQLVPSYKRLADFLKNVYLPHGRKTTGINSLIKGNTYYKYLIHFWTTTDKSPEEIYQTGLSEVKRISGLLDSLKNVVGYKGDMKSFYESMKKDPKLTPFKTPEDVLNSFRSVQSKIEPHLKNMFRLVPKTPFEIRQTEAYRAATASAEYNPGSSDGLRPGIFYVPIIDATTYNITSGMEGLFLHEAIPGHHYQISLQMENDKLPSFRRFAFYGAYVEGWGLYSESLGKELGLYTDPYQYIGALGKEMHRSVRLVVDVGMHQKYMSREDAIKYMMDNMPVSEQKATAEIERYMAMPAQALSYKIGSLKLLELRKKFLASGKKHISDFHDRVLMGGAMPLDILDEQF